MKISLGSGTVAIEGFLRVDIDPSTCPDFVMDAQSLTFPEKSLESIYASHVLEHFRSESPNRNDSRWEYIVRILAHWRSRLDEQGRLFLCVPDLERLSELLVKYRGSLEIEKTILDAIYGGARNEFDFHCSGFTKAILESLLLSAGFTKIESFTPFVSDESRHTICGVGISLNLVATNSPGAHSEVVTPRDIPDGSLSELELLRRTADERLLEIAMLRQTCEDRRIVVERVSAENVRLNGELIRLREMINPFPRLMRVFRRLVKK